MIKVLVVEDQKAFRDAICTKLNSKGFATFQADNGKEGLQIARTEKPDLILLDLQMPVMDGFETLKLLREGDEWGKKVSVVVLTNFHLDDKILDRMINLKPTYYMVKSDWSLEEIGNKVQDLAGDPLKGLDDIVSFGK